jgi:hypothetical protein
MPIEPDTIEPDTKDWTWVLDRRCDECGYRADQTVVGALPGLIRANVAGWRQVLAGAPADVRRRPDPRTWSALEYGCHVRDVFRLFDRRLELMLTEQAPRFANWDQDQTAIEQQYDQQHPATVAAELAEAGDRIATRFAGVHGEQWQRTGLRSDGARFTVDSFGRYFLHDVLHHLHDVGLPDVDPG